MNIIELAKEAGFDKEYFDNQDCPCEECNFLREPLERFAALVRAELEWVELTDDEIQKACDETMGKINDSLELYWYRIGVARAVTAAFKEKNK